jgi:hypothetical protein
MCCLCDPGSCLTVMPLLAVSAHTERDLCAASVMFLQSLRTEKHLFIPHSQAVAGYSMLIHPECNSCEWWSSICSPEWCMLLLHYGGHQVGHSGTLPTTCHSLNMPSCSPEIECKLFNSIHSIWLKKLVTSARGTDSSEMPVVYQKSIWSYVNSATIKMMIWCKFNILKKLFLYKILYVKTTIQYYEATSDKFNTVGRCIGRNFIAILNFQFYNKLV